MRNRGAVFSPDGERIAFVSRRNFAPGIYTMNPDGKQQKKVSRGLAAGPLAGAQNRLSV